MDFASSPPEVTSARMYAGPGSGPLLAAAAGWSRLAAEWASAVRAYQSAIAGLTGEGWSGPAAEAMTAAAEPYAAWMAATAESTEQTAARMAAAAGAFEQARAEVVPPPAIAANRSQAAALAASNVLGQNSAAIAALEVEYLQMWVQDVLVMFGYATNSAAAAAVTPFAEPPPTTSPAGLGNQAAAVAQTAAGGANSQLSQLLTTIPQALNGLGSGSGSAATLSTAAAAPPSITLPTTEQLASYIELIDKTIVPFNDAIKSLLYGMVQFSRNLMTDLDFAAVDAANAAAAATQASSATGALVATGSGFGAAGSAVSAGIGNAATVGKLMVPSAWVQIAPAVKTAVAALPGAGPGAVAAAAAAPGGLFTDMALAGLAGRSIAGGATRGRPGPAAAMNGRAQGRLEKLVTELAGTHDVQHWHVDASRLDSLLEELAEQPGVHAVHVNPDGRADAKLDVPTDPGSRPQAH